jgi:tetratricopeptide (TPR) repeat protein
MRQRAEEYELFGDPARAADFHAARNVGNASDAELWFEFGSFYLRERALDKAEQCLRDAIAINQTHWKRYPVNQL